MIRINLLPVRQLQKLRQARHLVAGFLLFLLLLLVAIGATGLHQVRQIKARQTAIAALNEQKNSYAAVIKQIDALKKEKELLKQKLAVIDSLKKDAQLPVKILAEIAAKTPANRLWLKSLVLSGGKLQLTGVALDNATIAQFMRELRSSPYFIDADLANSSMVVIAEKKLKAFSLSCQLISYGQQEAADSAGKKPKR